MSLPPREVEQPTNLDDINPEIGQVVNAEDDEENQEYEEGSEYDDED